MSNNSGYSGSGLSKLLSIVSIPNFRRTESSEHHSISELIKKVHKFRSAVACRFKELPFLADFVKRRRFASCRPPLGVRTEQQIMTCRRPLLCPWCWFRHRFMPLLVMKPRKEHATHLFIGQSREMESPRRAALLLKAWLHHVQQQIALPTKRSDRALCGTVIPRSSGRYIVRLWAATAVERKTVDQDILTALGMLTSTRVQFFTDPDAYSVELAKRMRFPFVMLQRAYSKQALEVMKATNRLHLVRKSDRKSKKKPAGG